MPCRGLTADRVLIRPSEVTASPAAEHKEGKYEGFTPDVCPVTAALQNKTELQKITACLSFLMKLILGQRICRYAPAPQQKPWLPQALRPGATAKAMAASGATPRRHSNSHDLRRRSSRALPAQAMPCPDRKLNKAGFLWLLINPGTTEGKGCAC